MAYLKLLRPLNCILAATGVFVASVVTIGLGVLQGSYLLPILIASLSAALVTGAGNVLNDYLDRQTDKLNHPDRPIPSGRISPKAALYYSILLFLVPLPLSLIVRIECFLIVVFNIIVLISYERYFKRRGLIGNLEVSWLTGSIFIFGGFAAYQGNISLLLRTVYLALLAFFASLGREIAKDIQDVPGDIDRQTLPRRMGV
ncbi:MAG: UbiA family prenyltransferase, partial [Thermoplasmata archaeon]